MFGLRRRFNPKNQTRKNPSTNDVQATRKVDSQSTKIIPIINNTQTVEIPVIVHFAHHMSNYIGKTVTVFVASGGLSGKGFTGILLSANDTYIQLITRIGPAPHCAIGNSCFYPYNIRYNPYFVNTVGSIACIPINKITCFVHNAV